MFVRLTEFWEIDGASDYPVSEAIYLKDPDGHGIEVYADSPTISWRRAESGELYMATLPLNIDSLLAELRGQGKTAAARGGWMVPSETKIGHIHLHVSGLERAGSSTTASSASA